jgi:hypothetical protein
VHALFHVVGLINVFCSFFCNERQVFATLADGTEASISDKVCRFTDVFAIMIEVGITLDATALGDAAAVDLVKQKAIAVSKTHTLGLREIDIATPSVYVPPQAVPTIARKPKVQVAKLKIPDNMKSLLTFFDTDGIVVECEEGRVGWDKHDKCYESTSITFQDLPTMKMLCLHVQSFLYELAFHVLKARRNMLMTCCIMFFVVCA